LIYHYFVIDGDALVFIVDGLLRLELLAKHFGWSYWLHFFIITLLFPYTVILRHHPQGRGLAISKEMEDIAQANFLFGLCQFFQLLLILRLIFIVEFIRVLELPFIFTSVNY
jgi:hypothetical protein